MNKENHRRKKNAQNPKNQKKKQIKEKEKNREDIKDINKLKYEEMRYFGKNINNITSLKERNNQYIVNGNNFKQLFEKRFMNNSLNIETDELFELISIKYVNNPQYVIQYRKDIFLNLLRDENKNYPNYSEFNNIISNDKRLKYILFLIQVCDQITEKEEIHYLSINIFDRVLYKYYKNKKILDDKTLQLICFTSLFIAYKYETGYYFLIEDLIKHTEDSLVTKEQVLKFEYEINSLLDFEYLIVYPNDFLKHYELIDNYNKNIYYFCLFLIDFILSSTKLMSYKKSLITASCYYIAKVNITNINTWPNVFQLITGYNKEEIKDFAVKIIKEMKDSKSSNIFKCLNKKYSKEEYCNIAGVIMSKKK